MIQENVSLKPYSNYAIGGTARYFCRADGLHVLRNALMFVKEQRAPFFILGGGTNILLNDEGFNGLVIKPDFRFLSATRALPETVAVSVGAGMLVSELLDFCTEHGLSGLEWAGGLPGTVGGAIRGNAGAFRGEIKDVVHDVTSFDITSTEPRIIQRTNSACGFGYRDSIFKQRDGKEIIISATLSLLRGNPAVIGRAIAEKVAWRESRQPLDYPNVGSIFKNVAFQAIPEKLQKAAHIARHIKTDPFPVIPAACLIDQAGLKGVSCGGAMVSQKHPNFIVNAGAAEAAHVKQLIALVKKEVKKEFGVALEEEIVVI